MQLRQGEVLKTSWSPYGRETSLRLPLLCLYAACDPLRFCCCHCPFWFDVSPRYCWADRSHFGWPKNQVCFLEPRPLLVSLIPCRGHSSIASAGCRMFRFFRIAQHILVVKWKKELGWKEGLNRSIRIKVYGFLRKLVQKEFRIHNRSWFQQGGLTTRKSSNPWLDLSHL